MRVRVSVLLLAILSIAIVVDAAGPPWRRRRTGRVPVRRTTPRVAIDAWPQEPAAPRSIAEGAFGRGLERLCIVIPRARARRYAGWILEHSREFRMDPFLLGALLFETAECRNPGVTEDGIGPTQIAFRAFRRDLRRGTYAYYVLQGGEWRPRELKMERFLFREGPLQNPEVNLYFAAGLLAMWKDQHPGIDEPFESIPHRHFVSHWRWADRVWTTDFEENVLVHRRRLLEYAGVSRAEPRARHGGLTLGSPLDGAPRVVVSDLGDARAGDRHHRGSDFDAMQGEPVRAVADGRITFAGVDRPGSSSNENLSPEEAADVPEPRMGPGGRFVCISHGGGEESLRTCYMHLLSYETEFGDRVRRGQEIGKVGRSGIRSDPAHLHLEIRTGRDVRSAREILGDLVVDGRDPRRRRR